MERMTTRSFRARFHKVDEPTLVGDGIWFPHVTAGLMAIAEEYVLSAQMAETSDMTKTFGEVEKETLSEHPGYVPASSRPLKVPARSVKDLSKTAQAKGKMGR